MDTKKMRACAPLLPPPGNEVVCECLDEIERLRAEAREADALREKLAGILSRTAVSLRGPEPPLTRWSWHDLPERAAAAIAAIDVMQRAALMAAPEKTDVNRIAIAEAGVRRCFARRHEGRYAFMPYEDAVRHCRKWIAALRDMRMEK